MTKDPPPERVARSHDGALQHLVAAAAAAPVAGLDPRGIVERANNRFVIDGRVFSRTAPGHVARIDGTRLDFEPTGGQRGCAGEDPGESRAASLTLETARIARRGDLLQYPPSPVRGQDGAVAIDRGIVIERFEAIDSGVEQTWEFASRPGGSGDLVVEVVVGGQTYDGESAEGLHFSDASTGRGVTYGHGTWIDGAGERTPVPAHFEEGRIALRVPAAIVERSAYPAVLDPSVVSDYDRAYRHSSAEVNDQVDPVMASDYREGNAPSTILVAWTDRKCGQADVRGIRVNPDGTFVDEVPIPIAYSAGEEQAPSVAYSLAQDEFVIVYEKQDPGYGIYLRHVEADGSAANVLLDLLGQNYREYPLTSEVLVRNQGDYEHQPDVSCAYDGTGKCHVTWSVEPTGVGSWGVESATLSYIGPNPNWSVGSYVDVTNGISGDHRYPRIAAHDSSGYLVVWFDESSGLVRIADVDAGARTSYRSINTLSTAARMAPDIDSANSDDGGSKALVVWPGSGSLRGQIVDSGDGSSISGTVSLHAGGGTDYTPMVAYDHVNNEWLVQWWRDGTGIAGDDDGYYSSLVTTAGVFPGKTLENTSTWDPADGGTYLAAAPPAGGPVKAAGGGTEYMLIAPVKTGGNYDIQLLNPAAGTLSRLVTRQTVPAVEKGGSYYMVAWSEQEGETNGNGQIWASRVEITSVAGQAYQTFDDGLNLGTRYRVDTSGTNTGFAPSIGWDGSSFVLAWVDARVAGRTDLRVRLHTPGNPGAWGADTLLKQSSDSIKTTTWDTTPDTLGEGGPPAIACASGDTPNECVVAYVVVQGGAWKIRTQLYDADGRIDNVNTGNSIGNNIEISVAAAGQRLMYPTIAWCHSRFVVTWTRSVDGGTSDIQGAWVLRDNSAKDGAVFNISAVNDGKYDERSSVACYTTDDSVVVWHSKDPTVMSPRWRVLDKRCQRGVACGAEVVVDSSADYDKMAPWIDVEYAGFTCGFDGYRVAYLDTYTSSTGALLSKVKALTTTGGTGALDSCANTVNDLEVRKYPYSEADTHRFQRPMLSIGAAETGLLFHDAPLESICRTRVVSSNLTLD